MYYFCRQDLFKASNTIEITGHTEVTGAVSWTAGHRFTKPMPHQTLMIDPKYGTEFPAYFDTTVPVMSDDLIQILHGLGVNNFDTYSMTLKRIDNGKEYNDFKAINFIGNLDCIDYDNSVFELNKRKKPRRFKSIVIDKQKTHGAKSFRLSIGPDFLVLHSDIVKQLSSYNFKALLFQRTTDYDGF